MKKIIFIIIIIFVSFHSLLFSQNKISIEQSVYNKLSANARESKKYEDSNTSIKDSLQKMNNPAFLPSLFKADIDTLSKIKENIEVKKETNKKNEKEKQINEETIKNLIQDQKNFQRKKDSIETLIKALNIENLGEQINQQKKVNEQWQSDNAGIDLKSAKSDNIALPKTLKRLEKEKSELLAKKVKFEGLVKEKGERESEEQRLKKELKNKSETNKQESDKYQEQKNNLDTQKKPLNQKKQNLEQILKTLTK